MTAPEDTPSGEGGQAPDAGDTPAQEPPAPGQADDTADPVPCSACRGTGVIVSNLGGTPSQVSCPWCEGSGTSMPAHDAQARWREGESPEPPDVVA